MQKPVGEVKERPTLAGSCEVTPRCTAAAAGASGEVVPGRGHSLAPRALHSSSRAQLLTSGRPLPLPLAGPQFAHL